MFSRECCNISAQFFIKHLQTTGFEIGWFYILVSRKDPIIYGRIFSALSVTLIFEYSLQYMSREEWQAVRSFDHHRNTEIKKADKGSCVVILDQKDHLLEAEKQLSNSKVYGDVSSTENILDKYQKQVIKCLAVLNGEIFLQRANQYFTYEFKKLQTWANYNFSLRSIKAS